MDTSASDWKILGKICVENFGLIKKKLALSINEALHDGAALAFSINERHHGFHLLLCSNQESLEFIEGGVSLRLGSSGANIEGKISYRVSCSPKIKFLVPDIDFTP